MSTWSSRRLSYGGRVTLINSVLSSLPLYFFSFFKAPRCIINQLVKIQRKFLWGGGVENKKICWIKWDHICLPREKGGLGVKNLELFNLSLLSKWKWRLLSDEEASWTELLRFRYGSVPSLLLGGVHGTNRHKESIWWKDILANGRDFADDWFRSNVGCNVGDGRKIGFWTFKWYGNQPFKDLFSDLFAKEAVYDVSIADRLPAMDSVTNGVWQWSNPLSDNEQQQLQELVTLLAGFSLSSGRPDSWRWIPGTTGIFSVKSCYNFL
jgi:hypothetical protein